MAFICIVCTAEPLTSLHCSFVSHLLRFACLYDFSFSSVFLTYLYEFFIHCRGHTDFFFFLNIYSICLVGWCIYLKSELCSTMAKKYPVSRFILLIGEVMRISLMCRVTEHQGSGSVFQFIAFAFLYRETAPVVDFPLSLAIISQKPLLLL